MNRLNRASVSAARRESGFSLLEVLVAFVIMGLSLGVLYQASGGGARGVGMIEQHAFAVVTAESLLSRYQSVPAAGISESGVTNDGFHWRLSSRPFETPVREGVDASQSWPFHLLSVTVAWQSAGREYAVSLDTLVPEMATESAK